MTHEERIHSLNDIFNKHDSGAFASYYAENAVVYDPVYPEPLRGRTEIEKDVADFFRAFPDIRGEISAILENDNMSAEQWTLKGTNAGPLAGPDGEMPATGRKITLGIGAFSRYNDEGLIIEQHRYYNVASLFEQLGQTGLAQPLT